MPRNLLIALILFLTLSLIYHLAPAANASQTDTLQFSANLNLVYEQNAQVTKDGQRATGLDFSPKLTWNNFSLRGRFIYVYNLELPRQQSDWSDGVISLMYNGLQYSWLKISPFTSVELPLSKESRENREINNVVNFGSQFSLDTKALDLEKFNLSYTFSYGYFNNQYTTRVNGEPSTDFKLSHTIRTGYNFNPISLSLVLQFIDNYSYEDVVRTSFLHMQTISYKHNDTLGFSLYHLNKGPLLKSTTYENNLQAYDDQTSKIGTALELSF